MCRPCLTLIRVSHSCSSSMCMWPVPSSTPAMSSSVLPHRHLCMSSTPASPLTPVPQFMRSGSFLCISACPHTSLGLFQAFLHAPWPLFMCPAWLLHTAMPIVFVHALPYIPAIIRTPQPLPRCSNTPVPNPRCLAHLPVILSRHFGARQSHRLILQRTWSCLRHTTGMDKVQPSRHTHWHVKTCIHAARKLCRCARMHIHKCIDRQQQTTGPYQHRV